MNHKETPTIIQHVPVGQICCDPVWEAAYAKFETPEQEIQKFTRRLERFGFCQLNRNLRIVEIFCGRGNGLVALERMGFKDLHGVDLSNSLLQQYRGSAQLHLADCTNLPLTDASFDVVIVQGGLHHLPQLPEDLDKSLVGVRRVLPPEGKLYVIEPWRTPFLTFAHFVTNLSIVRKLYPKGDALATMTERERVTYEQWLACPGTILQLFENHFKIHRWDTRWGKLTGIFSPLP